MAKGTDQRSKGDPLGRYLLVSAQGGEHRWSDDDDFENIARFARQYFEPWHEWWVFDLKDGTIKEKSR